ncbi:hypothetical protein DSO57_1016131 [Entomophthora muscae]|nr:hypothetical protein DSO57_1016131 [Entomophthora muscae]
MNGDSSEKKENPDAEKIAFIIQSTPEYVSLYDSEEVKESWKKDFASCISAITDVTLSEYKKKVLTFLRKSISEATFTAESLNLFNSLRLFISDLFTRLIKAAETPEPSEADEFPATALLYNVDGNILFSGIKKLPGKLELPSDLQEVRIIDTHRHIVPPKLCQSCPTAGPTQVTFQSSMRLAYPAKPLYYGVYSSFAPSYDSSNSNISLGDGYDYSSLPRDKIDYELLTHEGIDYEFLLSEAEHHELTKALFPRTEKPMSPTQEPEPCLPASEKASTPSPPYGASEILLENSKRLQRLKLSQKVRMKYRDFKPNVNEIKTAFEFLHSTAKLADRVPPSKLMSEEAALRSIRRFPYKESAFKGTLVTYQPYPTSGNIWPNSPK